MGQKLKNLSNDSKSIPQNLVRLSLEAFLYCFTIFDIVSFCNEFQCNSGGSPIRVTNSVTLKNSMDKDKILIYFRVVEKSNKSFQQIEKCSRIYHLQSTFSLRQIWPHIHQGVSCMAAAATVDRSSDDQAGNYEH
jgi:hypothetical protein